MKQNTRPKGATSPPPKAAKKQRDSPEQWADLGTEQHLYREMGQEVQFFEPYLEDIGFIAPYMALLQMLVDPPNLIVNVGMHPHAIMAQVREELLLGCKCLRLVCVSTLCNLHMSMCQATLPLSTLRA